MATERAKEYSQALRDAANVPVDVGDNIDMKLPEFFVPDRMRRAQLVFKNNSFAMFYAMYCGLLGILAVPSILSVLVHTNKSSSIVTAYRRYMQTLYHVLLWFRHEFTPGTKAWKSLETIRKIHFSASRSAQSASVGIISQKDMVITQYGFMGFIVDCQKKLGIQADVRDMEHFCHFWRVLGSLIGIKDEYNLCCETYEETLERVAIVRTDFLLPALQFPPKDFEPMTKFIGDGLWYFNPRGGFKTTMFIIKRMIGVPNFYCQEDELPAGYDKSNLEINKLSFGDKLRLRISCFVHGNLLQIGFFRWYFNTTLLFLEKLSIYFPIFAICKFGIKDAYVKILENK